MRSIVFAAIAMVALAAWGPAQAADMPMKAAAPIAVPPPPPSWTGCYLGANVGLGVSRNHAWYGPSSSLDSLGSHTGSNLVGGGQVGCDYQFGSIVIGARGRFDGAPIVGSNHTHHWYQDNESRLQWFATAGGRAGFLVRPDLLIYGTGGAAWLRAKYGQADTFDGGYYHTANVTRQGWMAGGGAEFALTRGLSVFIEYNYMDLGTRWIPHRYGPDVRIGQQLHVFMIGGNFRFLH